MPKVSARRLQDSCTGVLLISWLALVQKHKNILPCKVPLVAHSNPLSKVPSSLIFRTSMLIGDILRRYTNRLSITVYANHCSVLDSHTVREHHNMLSLAADFLPYSPDVVLLVCRST